MRERTNKNWLERGMLVTDHRKRERESEKERMIGKSIDTKHGQQYTIRVRLLITAQKGPDVNESRVGVTVAGTTTPKK